MKDVFIIEALRTPFGSFGGTLADVPAPILASQVIAKLLKRNPVPGDQVDEVIIGQGLQGGCSQAPARQAMRFAGLPDKVHAMTINKVCGSGLKALMLGADSIRLGESGVVIAGGMESMSMAPYILPAGRFGQRMGHGQTLDLMIYDGLQDPYSGLHMGDITEKWIKDHGITREEQDEYAARSYRLAQTAAKEGIFRDELVAVVKKSRKGEVTVTEDEEPLRGNIEKLPGLRPVFGKDGSITAGNASTINDGAALALMTSAEGLQKFNLKPAAKLISSATHSLAPHLFGEAPVQAVRKCVERAGLKLEDVGLFEINEAFAAVAVLCVKQLGVPLDRVNVNGGAVAIGHPIGSSGARLAATLIREMKRRNVKYGVASICIGGGEAVATLFELV